jgi:hypothetical protein
LRKGESAEKSACGHIIAWGDIRGLGFREGCGRRHFGDLQVLNRITIALVISSEVFKKLGTCRYQVVESSSMIRCGSD